MKHLPRIMFQRWGKGTFEICAMDDDRRMEPG